MPDKTTDVLPSRLYKYQPYNTRTLDNLKKRVVWFSKPVAFNDPFDLSIVAKMEEVSDEELLSFYEFLSQELGFSREKFDSVYLTEGQPNREFRESIHRAAESADKDIVSKNQQAGVACFSEKRDDILMWSHYAEGHRGFCLEFDTSFAPFRSAFRVIYSGAYPVVNVARMFLAGDEAGSRIAQAMLTTKSSHWAYEKEWRLMVDNAGDTELEIDALCLTGIYFGCAMSATHKEILALMLADAPTKIYEMQRSITEFKVEACPIE